MGPERWAQLAIALVAAPALAAGYLWLSERLLGRLPERRARGIRPWVWLGPGLAFLTVFLVYPSVETIWRSLLDARSGQLVGLDNYEFVFTNQGMLVALRNSLLWVILFPLVTVSVGLVIAVLADRVPYEGLAKASIFLPMAISFVAAGVIWKLVYEFRPEGLAQTGLLNATLDTALPGFQPQAWLVNAPPLNSLALMVAAIWVWTGFCTVVLSAALKGVPEELIEAARVDGASELQVFRHVLIPQLAPTIAVVATTMVIFGLKAFDIVYVMTSGNFDTDVIASRMYKEMFNARDFGRASAIAVVLLVAIVPLMLLNLRRVRRQEGPGDATW